MLICQLKGHTSGILDHLLTEYRQCAQDHDHQAIEGMTKFQDHTGRWRTINRSTFAGWYTRPFCEDVIDSVTQEFALQDARNTSEISWLFYKDCGDLPDDGTWGDGKHSEAIARGILHGAAALLHVICGLWE